VGGVVCDRGFLAHPWQGGGGEDHSGMPRTVGNKVFFSVLPSCARAPSRSAGAYIYRAFPGCFPTRIGWKGQFRQADQMIRVTGSFDPFCRGDRH